MNIRTLLTLAFGLFSAAAFGQTLYTIQDLGAASRSAGYTPQAHGYALNDAGLVVGSSNVNNPLGNTAPYRFDGGPAPVATPNAATYGYARGVNDAGTITGYGSPSGGATRAFVTNGTTTQQLGSLTGSQFSYAYSINASGNVAGYYNGGAAGVTRGFTWDAATNAFTQLGAVAGTASSTGVAYALNDSGIAVGASDASNGTRHATVYGANGSILDLGAIAVAQGYGALNLSSAVYGINAQGDVVGRFYTTTSTYSAFVYSTATGKFTSLGMPTGASATAWGINAAGTIVGDNGSNGGTGAFVVQNGTTYGLYGLVTNAAALGFTSLYEAQAINALGQITGSGYVTQADGSSVLHAYILTPQAVPEPVPLAAVAMGALALLRRRRKA